ncbi:MAG: hypothetical protein LBI39_02750 [Puniceicoccales bacterium]|jgi:hypothetical protein|nr:hypothetical protein [Puniceicoccales bacterium]
MLREKRFTAAINLVLCASVMAKRDGHGGPDGQIGWCIAKLEEDYNWWVDEAENLPENPDDERTSILDPKQVEYVFDSLEPLREFGLRSDVVLLAFRAFAIDKELSGGRVRLVATDGKIGESDEKLFALPRIYGESGDSYAEFLDHISLLRIKYLNSVHKFSQQLTASELEEEVRDSVESVGSLPMHAFQEIASILEYCPAGFSPEEDDEDDGEAGVKIGEDEGNDQWIA